MVLFKSSSDRMLKAWQGINESETFKARGYVDKHTRKWVIKGLKSVVERQMPRWRCLQPFSTGFGVATL